MISQPPEMAQPDAIRAVFIDKISNPRFRIWTTRSLPPLSHWDGLSAVIFLVEVVNSWFMKGQRSHLQSCSMPLGLQSVSRKKR